MKRYTKEQLMHFLKKLSKELKKTPTIKDMNKKKKYPSASTYMKRFKTWNNALKKADLKINTRKQYSKDELVESLQLLAKDLGKMPKSSDLKKKKWAASYSTYRKYFGSWKKALKVAGLNKKREFTDLKSFSKRKKKTQ